MNSKVFSLLCASTLVACSILGTDQKEINAQETQETPQAIVTTNFSEAHVQYKNRCTNTFLNNSKPLSLLVDQYKKNNPTAEAKRSIHVKKRCRVLTIYLDGTAIKQYDTALSINPSEDKIQQGDMATPTGTFYIVSKDRQDQRETSFYKALHISYPNEEDAIRGYEQGLITKNQKDSIINATQSCTKPSQSTKLGSLIKIHGLGGYFSSGDWTHGCMGLDNEDMDEIFDFAQTGCYKNGEYRTSIHIE